MMSRGSRASVPLALLLAGLARAQVPAGPEFQVSADPMAESLDMAARANGEFIAAWNPRGGAAVARRFTPVGTPRGGEFRVSASTTSRQSTPRVGLDARGGGVVAWTDQGDILHVFARRLSPGGPTFGGDFQVDTRLSNHAGPTVAMAAGGQFLVAWPDADFPERILGRRFDALARPLGNDFIVNTFLNGRTGHVRAAGSARGDALVVWDNFDDWPGASGVFGQRFDPAGNRVGGEFKANTHTFDVQVSAEAGMTPDGRTVVVWWGPAAPQAQPQIWARRYTSGGDALGEELAVSAPQAQLFASTPAVALDEPGNFVVAWSYQIESSTSPTIMLRRFAADGAPRAAEVTVGTGRLAFTPNELGVVSDEVGNVIVIWASASGIAGRRYGGMFPAGLAVAGEDNGVVEVSDHFTLAPAWRNLTGAAQVLQGRSSRVSTPDGLTLSLSAATDYGTVAPGAVGTCTGACFTGALEGTRPSGHVDLSFVETLLPDEQGQAKRWLLHVGGSFTDVPRASASYRFVETLLHRGVTAGCTAGTFCPAVATTRAQMAAFVIAANDGPGPPPPDCGAPAFTDVPGSSAFCPFVEELARRGVVAGCGGGLFCPDAPVSREQMAVFLLRTLDPALSPPACTTPMFGDVPASSAFCRWVEELARRGITAGCGGGNYCPNDPVTREQMAAFLTTTFGLALDGP